MLERLSIREKFRLLILIAIISFCTAAILVWTTLSTVEVNGSLYRQIVNSGDLVADVLPPSGSLMESYLTSLRLRQTSQSADRAKLLDDLTRLHNEFRASKRRWSKVEFPSDVTSEKKASDAAANEFFTVADKGYLPALARNDLASADRYAVDLGSIYEVQQKYLVRLISASRAHSASIEQAARDRILLMTLSLLALGLIVITAYTITLRRVENSIANPIEELLGIVNRVLAGDWRIDAASLRTKDEAAELLSAIHQIVEITQAELVKAEKMAALGQLVAGISHELNTPIGNSLLAVTTVDGELRRFREEFKHGLKRSSLTHLVDAVALGVDIAQRNLQRTAELLRSFKQVAVDRATSQRRTFFLDEVVSDTLTVMEPQLRRKKCSVVANVEANLQMDSFPGPLGQILVNLIDNAINHGLENSENGLIQVFASVTAKNVCLRLTDDGCGMSEDVKRRVFDPFFTTKMGRGGTGLGLHITHNIVYQLLGGTITVHSEAGAGTEFELVLPLTAP